MPPSFIHMQVASALQHCDMSSYWHFQHIPEPNNETVLVGTMPLSTRARPHFPVCWHVCVLLAAAA